MCAGIPSADSAGFRREEPLFFESGGHRLFGVLHEPGKGRAPRNAGIVFCAPFAEEKLWAHRVMVSLARDLAADGYPVLRFDHRGHGDSGGNFEDATVQSTLNDIQASREYLQERTGVAYSAILGLRLGASLALLAAVSRPADALIMIEPVLNGAHYLDECLRSNLATQMVTYGWVMHDRSYLRNELRQGRSVNIDGYLVSPEFYAQASAIDLMKNPVITNPFQIVQLSKKNDLPPRKALHDLFERLKHPDDTCSELLSLVERPFWAETRTYCQHAPKLALAVRQWLDKSCRPVNV